MTDKERLKKIVIDNSYKYSENPPFKLSSGILSPYYFDLKMTTLNPEGLSLIGKLVHDAVKDVDADGIGGLTLGADPIAISSSMAALSHGRILYPLIVRKEPKGHGTQKYVEGYGSKTKKVIVVDDVITTGGSTITAINRFRAEGIEVVKAVVIIDREECSGRENIEKEGVGVISIFKKSEFGKI